MNDENDSMNQAIGSITLDSNGQCSVVTSNNTIATVAPLTMTTSNNVLISGSAIGGITQKLISQEWIDDMKEKWIMNRVSVDHKVQEQELMKLKEVAPDYANEIKENIAKNASRDMVKKLTFTKKHDKDTDVHHFIGRVWMFTDQEMNQFIEDIKNA